MMPTEELILPPGASTTYRRNVNMWASMFNRSADSTQASPNYSRWMSNIVAGLMQAKPPEADGVPDDFDLSELVEETARIQSGLGVAFLRPVFDGVEWVTQVMGPTNVAGMWNHRRLSQTLVWTIVPDPTQGGAAIAVVERWHNTGDDSGRVVLEVWRGDWSSDGRFTGKTKLTIGSMPEKIRDLPAVAGAVADWESAKETLRWIHPVVWQWQNGHPAPIIAGNEHVVAGLERLWDQEQTDAEMARNRIAIDTKMLSTSATRSVAGDIIAPAGFGLRDNVIALNSPTGSAQGIADNLPFHVIHFPDDLTQRERIERRENSLLETCGINPQSVGRSVAGRSDSAAAKRADQQMTLQTVATPARKMTTALQAQLDQTEKLNGRKEKVTVTIYEGVRPVSSEAAEEAQTLSSAEAASTRTLIRTAHPTWDDDQVDAELVEMAAEGRVVMPAETGTDPEVEPVGDGIREQSDALGVLIRAGVAPDNAADLTGLSGVEFTGAIPTSLRVPEADAAKLE